MLSTNNLKVIMQNEILPHIEKYGWAFLNLEHFFSKEILSFYTELYNQNRFRSAELSKYVTHVPTNIQSKIRNDEICWLELDDYNSSLCGQEINQFLTHSLEHLKNYFYISLTHFEAHFANYPKGHFYLRHSDQTSINNQRFFTFVIYLNENWSPQDCGEIQFYIGKNQPDFYHNNLLFLNIDNLSSNNNLPPNACSLNENTQELELTFNPEFGKIVFFRSDIEHQVLKSNMNRKTLTGWFRK